MAGDDKSAHIPFSAEAADALLQRLGTDDAFRQQFTTDPAAALESIGHGGDLARTAVSGDSCMMVRTLAPKEEILASRDALRSYLTSQGTHQVVHCFEAGSVESCMSRQGDES